MLWSQTDLTPYLFSEPALRIAYLGKTKLVSRFPTPGMPPHQSLCFQVIPMFYLPHDWYLSSFCIFCLCPDYTVSSPQARLPLGDPLIHLKHLDGFCFSLCRFSASACECNVEYGSQQGRIERSLVPCGFKHTQHTMLSVINTQDLSEVLYSLILYIVYWYLTANNL